MFRIVLVCLLSFFTLTAKESLGTLVTVPADAPTVVIDAGHGGKIGRAHV